MFQAHHFYKKFANTPLAKRMVPIDVTKHGLTTLNDLYDQIHRMEERLRPMNIEQERLLAIAEEYFRV